MKYYIRIGQYMYCVYMKKTTIEWAQYNNKTGRYYREITNVYTIVSEQTTNTCTVQ